MRTGQVCVEGGSTAVQNVAEVGFHIQELNLVHFTQDQRDYGPRREKSGCRQRCIVTDICPSLNIEHIVLDTPNVRLVLWPFPDSSPRLRPSPRAKGGWEEGSTGKASTRR